MRIVKNIKYILLISVIFALSSSGCITNIEEVYPNCYVNNVVDAEISYSQLVCSKDDVIYYYDSNAIYRYVDEKTELVFETEDVVKKMVCSSHGLYYVLREPPACDVLYKYDWDTKEISTIRETGNIYVMATHGDDIIISEGDSSCYLIRDEEKICITDLIWGQKEEFFEWEEYVFHIICGDRWNDLGGIYAKDGWSLFLEDSESVEVNGVKVEIDTNSITFDGEEVDYTSILEKNEYGQATSLSYANAVDNDLYILYQYCGGPNMYSPNSASYLRKKDAIYAVDVNTQEMALVYETEDNSEQIAGFSIERNEMYLVKQDGIYRCDMQGNNETKIVDGFYKTLVFENCNDYFFIYNASDLWEYKLLLID